MTEAMDGHGLRVAGAAIDLTADGLDEWLEHLETFALYPEFSDLLLEALEVIGDVSGALPMEIGYTVASIARASSKISCLVEERGGSLPYAIRFLVDAPSELSDGELIQVYAVAKANLALRRLADWMHGLEVELLDDDAADPCSERRGRLGTAREEEPALFREIVLDLRRSRLIEEGERREACIRLLGQARQALLLSTVYDSLDEKRQQAESARIARHQASSAGGKKGLRHHEWAYRYLEENLESLAYRSDGTRRSRNDLAHWLIDKILPAERKNQHPGDRPRIPSWKTLYGNDRQNPGWLIKLGFNDLPAQRDR